MVDEGFHGHGASGRNIVQPFAMVLVECFYGLSIQGRFSTCAKLSPGFAAPDPKLGKLLSNRSTIEYDKKASVPSRRSRTLHVAVVSQGAVM